MKNLKFKIAALLLFIINFSWACEACQLQQPKITRSFTHGQGPQGKFDWVIVSVVSIIIIYTLIYSIKYLAKPGEKKDSHIKYSILND